MAGACPTDLRSRVLAAVEAGEGVDAAAQRFAVERSTAYRWVAAARDEGRREAQAGLLPGPAERSGASPPEPAFVPIVTKPEPAAAASPAQPAGAPMAAIEVEVAGAVIRVLPGMDDGLLAAMLRAVRASADPA